MSRRVVHLALEPQKFTSHAVWAGNTLYVSGLVGMDYDTGTLAGMTAEDEAKQIVKNLATILKHEHVTWKDLVKVTLHVTNMKFLNEVTKVYAEYSQDQNYPTREALQVENLPKGAKVQMSFIFYKD